MPGALSATDEQLLDFAAEGNLNGVDEALENGADVNARGEFGDTVLNLVAQHGHLEVAKHLIESGADLENIGGANMTPLMNAALAGHIALVRLLLEKGAQISDDLLQSVQMKVNIFEENAELGMVQPEAVEAWRQFLEFLFEARQRA